MKSKLIGSGTQAYVFSIGNIVLKVFRSGKSPNSKLNKLLKKIDPDKLYFQWHDVVRGQPKVVIMEKLDKLVDPKKLTRTQYRHLRKAVDILQEHKILHGDLPGNVMLNPQTKLPVIIDFDSGKINVSKDLLVIDRNAFLTFFKAN